MNKNHLVLIFITIILLSLILFNFNKPDKMEIKSSAFSNKDNIPSKYTCDGENISPPLDITGIPKDTKSLVLIVDDPDAPTKVWVHWVVWNILTDSLSILEDTAPIRAVQGVNDFGNNNYGGPCPPSGNHRYMFKLYALDAFLEIPETSEKQDVETAMEGHIIEKQVLQGNYAQA